MKEGISLQHLWALKDNKVIQWTTPIPTYLITRWNRVISWKIKAAKTLTRNRSVHIKEIDLYILKKLTQ